MTGSADSATLTSQLRIHDLRGTAASLMISSGANIKAVQRQLGHASAAMTLDLYGHLYEDDLDTLSDALDRRYITATTPPQTHPQPRSNNSPAPYRAPSAPGGTAAVLPIDAHAAKSPV